MTLLDGLMVTEITFYGRIILVLPHTDSEDHNSRKTLFLRTNGENIYMRCYMEIKC